MAFYTCILANWPDSPMYIGHTDDLGRLIWEHREHLRRGFASRYHVKRLVWYEVQETREAAFVRERQLKKWKREWKDRLVREMNPGWADLYLSLNA